MLLLNKDIVFYCTWKPEGKHFIFQKVWERVGWEGGYYVFVICPYIQVP